MRKAPRTPVDIDHFIARRAAEPRAANRQLFEWLCDDEDRRSLYEQINHSQHGRLEIPSQALWDDDPCPGFDEPPRQGHSGTGSRVFLITARSAVEHILRDRGQHYSNRPYRALGSGSFMLGLDPSAPPDWHQQQRDAAGPPLSMRGGGLSLAVHERLVKVALRQGGTVALAQRRFDLAEYAESVALRYCILLFGFAALDYSLLRNVLATSYRAMNYQMFARHFVHEPATVPAARAEMARLARRADELIRDYDRLHRYPLPPANPYSPQPQRHAWPEGVEPPDIQGLSGFTPLLKLWSAHAGPLTGEHLTTMTVGMLAGIVANVQASVCIAIDHLQQHSGLRAQAVRNLVRGQARSASVLQRHVSALLNKALTRNPPAPFLPRYVHADHPALQLCAGDEVILCLGGATLTPPAQPGAAYDPILFGLQGHGGAHGCIGVEVLWPLLSRIVRQVAALPGLAHAIDPVDGEPLRLEKRWGFACEKYPLQYRRDRRLAQQPLQVIMRIKAPVSENAVKLRQVIRDGAPRIDEALRGSRHVHFAWFQIISNETELMLQTIYDGDFDAYILHFALKVDDLFDALFEYIEQAPPRPIRDFPEYFVETIRRFNKAPIGGYLFSAYPRVEVPDIERLGHKP